MKFTSALNVFAYVIISVFANKAVDLFDLTFEKAVLESNELWLVDFYAPWCGHCKKLSPVLDELAEKCNGKMRIGKMNAVQNVETAKKYNVDSYPTILYFQGGISGEYDGKRSVEGMLEFMRYVDYKNDSHLVNLLLGGSEPAVKALRNDRELDLLLRKQTVVFLLTEGDDVDSRQDMKDVFTKTAEIMRTSAATFATIKGSGTTRIQRLEHERPPKALPTYTKELAVDDLVYFVKSNVHPLVSTVDTDNFHQLTDLNLKMVLLVFNSSDPSTSSLKRAFQTAVKALPADQTEKLVFGMLDGLKFKTFTAEHGASPNSLLVLDPVEDTHYATREPEDLSGEGVSRLVTDVLGSTVHKPRPMVKSSVFASGMLGKIYRKVSEYYPWSLLCMVPLALLAFSFCIPEPYEDDGAKDKTA